MKKRAGILACLTVVLAIPNLAQAHDFGWDRPAPLTSTTPTFDNDAVGVTPRIASGDDRLFAAWTDFTLNDPFRGRNTEIVVRVSDDNGDSWGPPTNVSAAPGQDWLGAIAAASSTSAVIAWSHEDTRSTEIATFDGNSWTGTASLDYSGLVSSVAASGLNYLVAYGNRIAASSDGGQTWTSSSEPVAAEGARVLIHDMAASVIYSKPGNPYLVFAKSSNDGGLTWGQEVPLQISGYYVSPNGVTATSNGSTFLAAWIAGTGENSGRLEASTSTNAGVSWSEPTLVSAIVGSPYSQVLDAVTAEGQFEIFFGKIYSEKTKRLISSDGSTWTLGISPAHWGSSVDVAAVGPYRHLISVKQQERPVFAYYPEYIRGGPGAPTPTSITLDVSKTNTKVVAQGKVTPNESGSSVTVKLYRYDNGKYKLVARRETRLGEDSSYEVRFARPSVRRCKVVAQFPSNSNHTPSRDEAKFSC